MRKSVTKVGSATVTWRAKVLIADDDVLIRDMLSDILQASGRYDTVTAENGRAAFDACRTDRSIDLVLSDMNMPEMDGLALIKAIRGEGMEMPIVVLTGNNEISIALSALNSGASDYLPKDANIQETILVAVDKALEKKKIEDENRQLLIDLRNMNSELESVVDRMTAMGIALSSEKLFHNLIDVVLSHAMHLTNADAGLLWAAERDTLACAGLRVTSLNISKTGTGGTGLAPLKTGSAAPVARAAADKALANIPDVRLSGMVDVVWFDAFDAALGYRSRSMLLLPMIHHGDVMGVIQLVNARHPVTGQPQGFPAKREAIANSLALQAALALRNVRLFKEMEDLFDGIVELLAAAIDEKSPVTKGHISRVAAITMEVAREVNAAADGHFGHVQFSNDELTELRIAAMLHDVGKITTPEQVMEKATKLEKIVDRIGLVEERFRHYAAALTAEALQHKLDRVEHGAAKEAVQAIDNVLRADLRELERALAVIREANNPEEFMSDEKLERLKEVYARNIVINGTAMPLLTGDEFENLSIRKGSITPKELEVMRNHAMVTLRLLSRLPFTDNLKNVPQYAGGHHEKLDGTGYPLKLDESGLPLQTRIIALADLFEALTAHDRPYKKQIPLDKALEIMENAALKREIDPALFSLFREKAIFMRFSGGS